MSTSDFKRTRDEEGQREGFVPLGGPGRSDAPARFEPCVDCVEPAEIGRGEADRAAPGAQARGVVEEARRKAEHIEREAFEKGFAQGEKAGREMMERSLETTLDSLKNALSSLHELSRSLRAEMEEEVVRLGLAVAGKIIQREVATDSGLVKNVVRRVLEEGRLRGDVLVRVNALDLDTMRDMAPDIKRGLEGVKGLEIEADESVEQGGAVVECELGELDVRLERQLMEIEKAFGKLLAEGAGS